MVSVFSSPDHYLSVVEGITLPKQPGSVALHSARGVGVRGVGTDSDVAGGASVARFGVPGGGLQLSASSLGLYLWRNALEMPIPSAFPQSAAGHGGGWLGMSGVATSGAGGMGIHRACLTGELALRWAAVSAPTDPVLVGLAEREITQINACSLNHNGNMLITGCADGFVRMYDVRSGQSIMAWQAHRNQCTSVKLSVDEMSLVSTGLDAGLALWSLRKPDTKVLGLSLPFEVRIQVLCVVR